MERVIIQAAHQNIQHNASPHLRGGTGAPDEQTFTISLAVDLASHLRALNVDAVTVDANMHESVFADPAALFIALHYDSYSPTKDRGCRFARGIWDRAGEASDRMVALLVQNYPRDTGIPLYRNNQSTRGMREYYAFDYPTWETPAVIAELGVGHHPLDRPILCNEDGTASNKVALSLTSAITAFLAGESTDPVVAPEPAELVAGSAGPTNYLKALKWQDGYMNLVQIGKLERAGDHSRSAELDAMEAAYSRVLDGRDIYPVWRDPDGNLITG